MKRSVFSVCVSVTMALFLGVCGSLLAGCYAVDGDGFLGLERCDILNCDGLFFAEVPDDHDDMDDDDDDTDNGGMEEDTPE